MIRDEVQVFLKRWYLPIIKEIIFSEKTFRDLMMTVG